MSRPASLRPRGSPFVRRKEKQGSQKLGIDWENAELSYNHKLNDDIDFAALRRLRGELAQAIDQGRTSRVKKLRREINRLHEDQLVIRVTWCGGCGHYLHNCRCPGIDAEVSRSTRYRRKKKQEAVTDLVHHILRGVRKEIDKEGR